MTCPTHTTHRLVLYESQVGPLLVCPVSYCGYAKPYKPVSAADIAQAGGMRPEPPKPSSIEDTLEKTLVAAITHALAREGYEVLHVGQYRADRGGGNSVGYPDLSVRHPDWPLGISLLLEAKVGNGRLSPRQQELHDAGWSVVVRSVADAAEAVIEAEREIRKNGD